MLKNKLLIISKNLNKSTGEAEMTPFYTSLILFKLYFMFHFFNQ